MPHLHHVASEASCSVFFTLILVGAALVYLRGWLSVPSRGERTSTTRTLSFLVGLFLIWVAAASPLARLDHELLTIHMLKHLLLLTVAPPLFWLGAPVAPFVRGLPGRFLGSPLGRLWRSGAGEKFAKILGDPGFAWLAACATLAGWHIPRFFALGMQSSRWHGFEQGSFLVAGLLFWWPVVQPSAHESRQDLWLILYLFFATLPCDILSGFLVFSDRVVYPMYFSSSHLLGLSPLIDQQCAAALMWTCVTIVYFVAGGILTMRLLSPQGFSQVAFVRSKGSGEATSGLLAEPGGSLSVASEAIVAPLDLRVAERRRLSEVNS